MYYVLLIYCGWGLQQNGAWRIISTLEGFRQGHLTMSLGDTVFYSSKCFLQQLLIVTRCNIINLNGCSCKIESKKLWSIVTHASV